MRHHTTFRASAGIPAALAGSIALSLAATAAHAAPAPHEARTASARTTAVTSTAVAPQTYTVQRGDTVSSIAGRQGLRTADVLAWNGLGWRSVIVPGQVLRLSEPGAAPTTATAPAAPAAATTYVVKAGDTVTAIAARTGTTVAAILAGNGLTRGSIIYPGQTLALSGAAAAPTIPAAAPMTLAAASAPAGAYVVKAGDTVTAIARSAGTTVHAVLSANGLTPASIIYPGQTLAIPGSASAPADASAALDAEQTANARRIIAIGRQLGVPARGIEIALGTAMQESWLRNLSWGQDDSLGLFQQRPSAGWGTPAQIMDVDRSIRAFYGGGSNPNAGVTRGLLDIPGWQSLSFAQAAQAVQVSAYPQRYAQWEHDATLWLAQLG